MAAVHSPGSLMLSDSPTTPTRPTTTSRTETRGNVSGTRTDAAATVVSSSSSSTPKAPKLRDSCDTCAAAKVRCTKKKPTCTRCEKRGLHCEYIVTKRAGRPSQASTKSSATTSRTPHEALQRDTSEARLVASPNSSLMESSPTATHQEVYPNFLASTDTTTTPSSSIPSSWLTALNPSEFDDFFASLASFPGLETSTPDYLSMQMDTSDTTTRMHENTFSIAEDACSEIQSFTDPQTCSSGSPSITGYMGSVSAREFDSPCSCLITALGFLKVLFPNSPQDGTPAGKQMSENTGSALPTIQSVMAENERMVEAMDHILQCPCSQDGYLLTVVSLVVFKVLDCYAAAARVCYLRMQTSSPSVVSVGTDGEDAGRVAAQLVLSELHRTQRLVNKLSTRFKGHGMGGVELDVGGINSITDAIDIHCDKDGAWPFSTTMLDHLEADLRRRLRMVSSKVVDMLRRG